MTYLTVPIMVKSPEDLAEPLKKALDSQVDMIELRLDFLAQPATEIITEMVHEVHAAGLKALATCRASWEGGQFQGSDETRVQLLTAAHQAGADYIDIELKELQRSPINIPAERLIISHHDFDCLPDDFDQWAEKIKSLNAGTIKLAYMAKGIDDCFAGLDLLHNSPKAIALAMSEHGVISRLLAKKMDALITFASLAAGEESAPGQVTVDEMKSLYRWDAINTDTLLYGVIGCPIGHSLSPAIHNKGFDEIGFNGLYLPLLIQPEWKAFERFIKGAVQRDWLGFRGFSVTIPHKHHALEIIKQTGGRLEPLAEAIGAVNTLLINEKGHLSGYNTDYAGALNAITETLGIERKDLSGLRAAVIGAGGVSRAIVAGLNDAGAKVTIYNRTVEKAVELAEAFNATAKPASDIPELKADIIVNCTSLGMSPKVEGTPVPAEVIKPDMVVFDTVYNPRETRLLREARQVGAKTVDGVAMFVHQALLQFGMFTGLEGPKTAMEAIVINHLEK